MAATRVSRKRKDHGQVAPDRSPEVLQGAVEIDLGDAVAALREAARRFTNVVRSIDEPARRTRGLDWSLGDTAAHVLLAVRYDLDTLTGARSPYPVENDDVFNSGTKHNADSLRAFPERDPTRLADDIDAAVDEFVEEALRRGPRAHAPLAGGHAITVPNLVAVILGEMIVHGYDIARTIGKDLKIEADAARLAGYATVPFLPVAVNTETTKSVDVRYEIRIRGGESFIIHVQRGRVRSHAASGEADLHISADPIAYLLVAYGRTGPWAQLLRGRMFAWGRRPSLAFKLPTFFRKP